MNPALNNFIKDNSPVIDPRIGDGISYSESGKIPAFIDRVLRINSASFPKGMVYKGLRKATPLEGYKYQTRPLNNIRRYDINRNDIRMYVFDFEFNGTPMSKYIYLPFISRHGFMHMNGVKYVVSPVVADGIMTIKPNSIFVKLIKTKLWFERFVTQIVVDGVREYVPIYFSKIHHKESDGSAGGRMIKMKPTLVHYLCCKYGLTKTLELFGLTDVRMVDIQEFKNNPDQYPREDWVVIESTGKKPARTYSYMFYTPMQYLFLVPRKEYEAISTSPSVMGTLIYILEHFPSPRRMNPDTINNIDAWRLMLGESIRSSDEHYAVIKNAMDKHMISLDEYVDEMVHDDFKRIGFAQIDSVYKLFIFIVQNFNLMVSEVNKIATSNSFYGKQLQVLQFLLFNIVKAINRCYFELNSLRIEQERDPNKNIKDDDIRKILNNIRPEEIMRIKEHAEIIPVEDPTDLPLLKLGRIVVPQEKSDKLRTAKTSFDVNSPENKLNASLIEAGAALDMAKADPAGRNRINLFVNLSDDLTIIPNPKLEPIMSELRDKLGQD
nr:MAG TPA: hypothetical protein [Caudoviricetes sp.]